MEGEREIKVKEGFTQTIAYTDNAGGDYSAAIELTRVDFDKLKYTISGLPLALDLKKRLAKGSITVIVQY